MTDTSGVPTSILSAESTSTQSAAATSSTASISYPACARSCLADITSALPCEHTDSRCLCLHASSVRSSVTSCLSASGACSTADEASAALYYNSVCEALGYPTDSNTTQLFTASLVTATGSPSPTSTAASASTTTSQTQTQATASASSTAASTSRPTHLSVPAIAGIAAGSAFAVALIITFAVFMYVRRQQSDDEDQFDLVDSQPKNKKADTSETQDKSELKRKSSLLLLEKPRPLSNLTMSKRSLTINREALNCPSGPNPTTPTLHTPPMTLVNATDTWYNKKQAEMSTTSLTSKAPKARNPIARSPSVTELSDAASIHSLNSMSSYASYDEAQPTHPSDSTALDSNSLAPPPQLHRSNRRSLVVDSQHFFNPPTAPPS